MRHRTVTPLWVGGLLIAMLGLTAGCGSSAATMSTDATAPRDSVEQRRDDEEVNIGYGTVKRSQLTGSVSTVDVEKTRRERNPVNLSDLLRGNVAGVYVASVAGGVRVQIRGISSFHGSTTPLYVVDGMPVQPGPGGVLHVVNPYDVKSITVLKGPEAAIYGSRGANGVIIIETE